MKNLPNDAKDSPFVATVVITTRNRKNDLSRAISSALSQTCRVEVIVTDDASDDGTEELVLTKFPSVKLLRSETCKGYVSQRNLAATASSTNYIFSLDDDAEFGSIDTVAITIGEFDRPEIGAVAIPHIDTLTNKVVNAPAERDGGVVCIASYTGTAHALRRDVFLSLGGYLEELTHQGEESDYCIRMLAAGYVTRLGTAPLILHHESPRRSFDRMDFYGRRNDVLFGWRYAPLLMLPFHLVATTFNGLRVAISTRRIQSHCHGLVAGWRKILSGAIRRNPVSMVVYFTFRTMKKSGCLSLDTVNNSIPLRPFDQPNALTSPIKHPR